MSTHLWSLRIRLSDSSKVKEPQDIVGMVCLKIFLYKCFFAVLVENCAKWSFWLSLYKLSGHQCKAGSDLKGKGVEGVGGEGGGHVPAVLGERQDARPGGGDVGEGVIVGALLVGEAGLQPSLHLGVGEAEVAGGLPHLTHHKHLLAAWAWASFWDRAAWIVPGKPTSSKPMANKSWRMKIVKDFFQFFFKYCTWVLLNIVRHYEYCGFVSGSVEVPSSDDQSHVLAQSLAPEAITTSTTTRGWRLHHQGRPHLAKLTSGCNRSIFLGLKP